MARGFVSLVLVVLLAGALFVVLEGGHESEGIVSRSELDALAVEKDYYLRAGLREAMKSEMARGGREGSGEGVVARLLALEEVASRAYADDGVHVSFWCAQSDERGLAAARKWGLSEVVDGACVDGFGETVVSRVPACSLMLAVDSAKGEVAVVRAGGVVEGDGRVCAYPSLAGGGPSVIGASVKYADGGESLVVLPEGLVVKHGETG